MKCPACMALKVMRQKLVCSPSCQCGSEAGPELVADGSQLKEAIVQGIESDLVFAVRLSLPKTYLLNGKVWFMWEEFLRPHKSRFVFAAKGSQERRSFIGNFRTTNVALFIQHPRNLPFIYTMGFRPWLSKKTSVASSTHIVIHPRYEDDLVSVNGQWHSRDGEGLYLLSEHLEVYDFNECSFPWSQARLSQRNKQK